MAAKLTSMKRNPSAIDWGGDVAPGGASKYPYGLTLHLDDEVLSMLSMEKLPEVGTDCMIHAKASVTSVSEDVSDDGEGGEKKTRRVTLQITDLAITHGEEDKETKGAAKAETVLYGQGAGGQG